MPPIQRTPPPYEQIADDLRRQIEQGAGGRYPPGSRLPSESELEAIYGEGRKVIRDAVQLLQDDGLVRKVHGSGTYVRDMGVIHSDRMARYLQSAREANGGRGAFDAEIRALGYTPESDTTVTTGYVPPDFVAAILQLPPGEPNTVCRYREMYAVSPNGERVPVQLAPSYIPSDIADGTVLAEQDSGPGGIVSRFADLGFEQVRITEQVTARLPDIDERAFLGLAPGQVVLQLVHTGWTEQGRAVEVAVHVAPAAQWALEYGWRIA